MRNSLPAHFRGIVAIASIAFVLLGFAPVKLVRAQTTGILVGQVFDAAGNPLPGVKVTITNVESGNSVAVLTDESGTYRRPFLFPGPYRITASKQGLIDDGVDARVPLNSTTLIQPPAITIRPATISTTVQPPITPTTTKQPAPAPAPQGDSSILVNKTDPTRGANFTNLQLWTLPLGGGNTTRSFDELALLVPGVAAPPQPIGTIVGPGVGAGVGTSGQFSVNGLRARSNNFTIDGSDNNDPDIGVRRQGFVALVPQSPESVQEFRISTLLWDAEFGRNFGSQVNAVTKGGGSQYHGQAYEFFTDSSLNARNFFNSSGRKDPFTRSLAGFVLGGPMGSKRTQFFFSFEHDDVNASTTQHFSTPTTAERRFLGAPRFTVNDPTPSLLTFSTTAGVTPLGSKIYSFYPLPNNPVGPYGANTFTEVLPANGDASIGSFRVSHQFETSGTLNARYNITDDSRLLPSVNRAIKSTIEADTRTQDFSLIYDSALSASFFNQARFSFGRTRLSFPEYPGSPFVFQRSSIERIPVTRGDTTNIEEFPSATGPLGEIMIEPFSPVGVDVYTFPQSRVNNTFQFADTASWTVKSHSIKFGADIRRFQLNSRQDRNYRPLAYFGFGAFANNVLVNGTPQRTGLILLKATDIASLGFASTVFQTIAITPDSTIGLRFTEYSTFFNDNWRVKRNFTLDYGLRYEYNAVPREANNRIEDALSLNDVPSQGRFPQNVASFNAAIAAYKNIVDGRGRIYDPDRNNFGPHVGFAWDPQSNDRMSIRAGYGIYYDTILGAVVSQSRNTLPREFTLNVEGSLPGLKPDVFSLIYNPSLLNVGGIPVVQRGTINTFGGAFSDLPDVIGGFLLPRAGDNRSAGGLAFTLPEKHLRTPYAQQWHLSIERQVFDDYLLSAAYVGTKGTKLTRLTTPNGGTSLIPFLDVLSPFTADTRVLLAGSFLGIRPQPALGPFQIFENSASSNYNALQLEARKRYGHGYQFTLAYTWSHAIDDVSDVFPLAGAPILPQGRITGQNVNQANYQLERADANYDVRHLFTASLVWDLPLYRNSTGGVGRILGGWQITSIFQAHSGQPFTLNVPFDSNLDGNLTDRPSTTEGLTFFHEHGPQRVQLSRDRTFLDYLNLTVGQGFVLLPGTGFVGRNTVRGDGFINWDLAFNKKFRFSESQNLEFRTEFFNLPNRANFGIPIRVIGAPGFGSSVDTANPARIIQFALKYSF